MKQSKLEFFVGTFVVVGLATIVWFAIRTGAGAPLIHGAYEVKARFTNVGGLRPGSPVLIAGVSVGRVVDIVLDKQFAAVVDMRLTKDLTLSTDTIASIKTSGLIGDKFVALSPGSDEQTIAPGGTITETESSMDIESLISRFAFGNAITQVPAK